ncbi:UNVERIFIED_CONTAM: hypothetical protein PYX00_007906 [Menopon gallinae]
MKCEWAECSYETMRVDDFIKHVESHNPQVENRDSGVDFYCCLWESCGFDSTNRNVVVRHVNYHSYHTKIKAIGTRIMKTSKLPNCTLDYAGRNLLPVLPELNCEWEDCHLKFSNFQTFLYHVQCHVHVLPQRRALKEMEKTVCNWRDCKKTFKGSHKLRDHVRTHTQEKLVGCPVCGTQFSNKTKFYDHCKRQMPVERKGFKCSHCRKNFATERILRDHIRLHINKYKCPYCDMTCPFQSTLVLHIRYRHMDEKPFKCSFCEHRSKTLRDLENHQLTHCSENFWVCEQEDCDYSCRSKYILQEHYNKDHSENMDRFQYCCHICPKKYKRGGELTIHLKAQHSYRWASGHSRFKYIRGDDGSYRLQTVRYESIEVTKEMMKTKTNKALEIPRKQFKCVFQSPGNILIKECEEEEEEEEDEPTESRENESDENEDEDGVKSDEDGDKTDSSDSSSFGENLKKYLGLTGTSNFIKVVRSNKDGCR